MAKITCIPFGKEHVEAAVQIALANYEEERAFVPELPEGAQPWDLGYFTEHGYGVAALEEGRLVGYLCFFEPWSGAFDTENALGTFSPLHANGTVKENRYRICQDLYEAAAAYLAAKKIQGLGICLYAHDEVSKRAMFEYGFGMRCKDSIRKLGSDDLSQLHDPQLQFAELRVEEFPLVRDMRFALSEHLKESPCFVQADDDDFSRWLGRVEKGDRRTFVAKKDGVIAAYIDIAEEGENFATVNPKMRSIQGAYCRPEFRGMGIYDDLLCYVSCVLQEEGFEYLGVDYESYNPTAVRYWSKHFSEYTNSVTRRIELWCKDYE